MEIKNPPKMLREIIIEKREQIPFKPISTMRLQYDWLTTQGSIINRIQDEAPQEANAYYQISRNTKNFFKFMWGVGGISHVTYYNIPAYYRPEF